MPDQTPALRINEVMLANSSFPSTSGEIGPWIEVINVGREEVALDELALATDDTRWQMPPVRLGAGQVHVLQALRAANGQQRDFLEGDVREISILTHDEVVVERVKLPILQPDESFSRYPNGRGDFSTASSDRVTLGRLNLDPGFTLELASETALRPSDSSPNAIVAYGGYFYILGGWSNYAHDVWYSVAAVWRSNDGVHWQLINSEPPYSPYSSFIVWKDRIWALGPSSFSSSDGVNWRPEKLSVVLSSRSVVFQDMLVCIYERTVIATRDGETWLTLTEAAPWMLRVQPSVVVHRGRIWLFGGGYRYGTPSGIVFNDVWASSDGRNWQSVSKQTNWLPRYWSSAVVLDDKIFVIGGANLDLWPEENGNTAEVWYTDDGTDWLELPSELRWQARHASYTVRNDDGVLLVGGYGHGGVERIHNDAWSMRVSMYFPKPKGALHRLRTWGKNLDGTGRSPRSFHDDYQVFVLRNRPHFSLDDRWSVSGAGSRIVVGDGNEPVSLVIGNTEKSYQPLYLNRNSTTIVKGDSPRILWRDPDASLTVTNDAAN